MEIHIVHNTYITQMVQGFSCINNLNISASTKNPGAQLHELEQTKQTGW